MSLRDQAGCFIHVTSVVAIAITFTMILKFYLFMAALGLHCCSQAFSSCSEWGLHLIVVHGLLSLWSSDPRAQRQKWWQIGRVAPRHVESSQSRDRFCVPHIDRRVLGHWTAREFYVTVNIVDTYVVLWRRKWQPTPVFLPGKFQGWRSLVGCSPGCCKQSDRT